jgi:hypothetical protein
MDYREDSSTQRTVWTTGDLQNLLFATNQRVYSKDGCEVETGLSIFHGMQKETNRRYGNEMCFQYNNNETKIKTLGPKSCSLVRITQSDRNQCKNRCSISLEQHKDTHSKNPAL